MCCANMPLHSHLLPSDPLSTTALKKATRSVSAFAVSMGRMLDWESHEEFQSQFMHGVSKPSLSVTNALWASTTSYGKGTYYPRHRPLWRLHGNIYWAPTCNKVLRTWFLLNIDHLAHSSTSNLRRIDGCKKMFRDRQDMRTITREWNIKDTVQ